MNKEQEQFLAASGLQYSELQHYRLRPLDSGGFVHVSLRGTRITPELLEQAPILVAKLKVLLEGQRKGRFGDVFYDTRKEPNPTPIAGLGIDITRYTPPGQAPNKPLALPGANQGNYTPPAGGYKVQVNGNTYRFGTEPEAGYPSTRAQIWQVFFAEEQKKSLLPGLTPYDNTERATKWLESQVIADVATNQAALIKGSDYVGVLSHRWPVKHGKDGMPSTTKTIAQIIDDRRGQDIISLWHGRHTYNTQHLVVDVNNGRTNAVKAFQIICQELGWGKEMATAKFRTVRWNAWLAKPEVFYEYVELLRRVMALCETNQELKTLCDAPQTYKLGKKRNGEEQLEKVFGLPDYTLHPFVGENLFPLWVHQQGRRFPVRTLDPVKL